MTRPPESRHPAGRAHALINEADERSWACSLCDWRVRTTAAAGVVRAAFAGDDRHAAARPVVEALATQSTRRDLLLELVPDAARAGAVRVALADVVSRWRFGRQAEGELTNVRAVRAAWPALASSLDSLERVVK